MPWIPTSDEDQGDLRDGDGNAVAANASLEAGEEYEFTAGVPGVANGTEYRLMIVDAGAYATAAKPADVEAHNEAGPADVAKVVAEVVKIKFTPANTLANGTPRRIVLQAVQAGHKGAGGLICTT